MKRVFASIILIMLVNLVLTGCGSNSSTSTTTMQSQSGNVFVTGEDAPLPSVVGFDVTIGGLRSPLRPALAAVVQFRSC